MEQAQNEKCFFFWKYITMRPTNGACMYIAAIGRCNQALGHDFRKMKKKIILQR